MGFFAEVDPTYLLPIVLYAWLAISIAVYFVRWRRRKADREAEAGGAPSAEDRAPRSTGTSGSSLAVDRAARTSGTTTGRPATGTPSTGSPGSLVEAVIREEIEARKRAEAGGDPDVATDAASSAAGAAGRSGLFAAATSDPAPDRPRPTVAAALAGIDWPCDLAPLVTGATDPHRVAFMTRGVAAEDVGAALGDELERLGFSLSSVNDTTARATRADAEVEVVIHPDPARVVRDGARAFPTANAASVVVEFST